MLQEHIRICIIIMIMKYIIEKQQWELNTMQTLVL